MAVLRRRLGTAVLRLCPRWLAAEREDLVQTACVRILESARRAGKGADLNATYLWKTAHSVVLDEVRRVRWRYERGLAEHASSGEIVDARDGQDPERKASSLELAAKVRDCLRGLSADRRRAVQLRLAGFAREEMVSVLVRDEKQVANLVFRGMEDLRRCLRGKGVEA